MSEPVESSPTKEPESAKPPSNEDAARSARDKKALRRKTIKFVTVFVVSVFAMLVGYDYAKVSKANDWYLYQVARSTTWLLKYVGYSCALGSSERFAGKEAEVRASLDAWSRGEEPPTPPPASIDRSPLSAWESWEYQAAGSRRSIRQAQTELDAAKQDTTLPETVRNDKVEVLSRRLAQLKLRDVGPLVSFVYKPSVSMRFEDAQKRLTALQQDSTPDPGNRAARINEAQAEVDRLKAEVDKAQTAPPPYSNNRHAMGFNFVVIPDCGAVQSMAIFVSAILAFPSRWWKRILGILVGLPVLFWVNSFRLAFLGVVGAIDNGGEWFKFAHEYVWQGIYIVFVVALWMAWVEFIVRRRA